MIKKKKPSLLRSAGTALAVVLGIIAFAYGVQVTDVNFETTRSEDRLTQLKRVIRALVKPDIIEYDLIETDVEIPFYLPCPVGQAVLPPEVDTTQPYLTANVYCASPQDQVIIEGYNFSPGTTGPLDFITASGVKKPLGDFNVNSTGSFQLKVEMPIRQPVADAQHIRATVRVQIGGPKITQTAKISWDRIIETVFMALLATVIGTVIAFPVSFLAARNLMSENKSPLTSVSFSIIAWPIAIYLGLLIANQIRSLLNPFFENPLLAAAGLLFGVGAIYFLVRWSLSPDQSISKNLFTRILRPLSMIAMGLLAVVILLSLEWLSRLIGLAIQEPLGSFGFIGNFLFQIGEASYLIIPAFSALATGAILGSSFGRIGQTINNNSPASVVKAVNLVSTALAGAALFALIGAGINWLYQIDNLAKTLYWPAGIGGCLGLILALIVQPKRPLPTGMALYFIIRTILNGTRSVESLIMAIIFVIWVGIGPFAGSLALALHTLAALAKLYSEQVESILPGPLEAIQATGANRLQTIVYAVVPQIVSPYISFTMYRWDINVRMSTIIGFVGGGGIGFLLQQNINLLNYRAASVQMLAIAVVVALMDYISSAVREKMV